MYRLHASLKQSFAKRFGVDMQEMLRGAGIAFALRVSGAGFGFMFNVLLARRLGAEGAGIYYLAFVVVLVGTVAGRMGLDNALLRFTAVHAAAKEWGAVKGVYRRGISLALPISALSAVVVMASAGLIAREVFSDPSLASPLRWMSLAIVPVSLFTLHGELLKGLSRVRDAAILQGAAVSVLSLLLFLVARPGWGVMGAVFAYTGASVLVLIVSVLLWRKATPQLQNLRGEFSGRVLASTAFPLLLVASMDLVMTFTDTIMLGIFGQAADVGVYGAAMRTAMLTSFVLIAVNSVVAPKFAALFGQGDFGNLEAMARQATGLMLLLAAPVLLVFLLVPGLVMTVFGENFETGALALALLAAGQFFNVAAGPVGYLLAMSGNQKIQRNISICAALLNVSLNLLLIPWYGINGAALATATSWIMMNLAAMFFVRRKLGVSIWTRNMTRAR